MCWYPVKIWNVFINGQGGSTCVHPVQALTEKSARNQAMKLFVRKGQRIIKITEVKS